MTMLNKRTEIKRKFYCSVNKKFHKLDGPVYEEKLYILLYAIFKETEHYCYHNLQFNQVN